MFERYSRVRPFWTWLIDLLRPRDLLVTLMTDSLMMSVSSYDEKYSFISILLILAPLLVS